MGVPKLYRFLVDRYPCASKTIKEHEIPTYDNLYLDMNSIVHACSHPTDSDVYFRIGKKEFSDEDIFENVSRYVDLVFRIIKPLNVMFLAFDGVTPRAKINQQRSNRFRVAKKPGNAWSEVVSKELFEDELLDTNCITPGTAFMVELIELMRHFIAYKISTDPMWQKCRIVLSGPEVPGEGEHKIMEYIRYKKAQPNYNVNTRHCVYSLDADMIMLGLCCHEIHFSLIRETVCFGKKRMLLTPEQSDFYLLHLCTIREYMEQEFRLSFDALKIKQPFDLEKIIDDFLVITFLVGNDFIPQLPNLNIVDGALPFLCKAYVKVFKDLNGYINESGVLNFKRFIQYLKYLSEFENKLLKPSVMETENLTDCKDASESNSENKDIKENLKIENLKLTDSNVLAKTEYYKTKLKVTNFEDSDIKTMAEEYIKAIQWTLSYYYEGCASWSWYYPYHYAPCLSDIISILNVDFKFDFGKPFLPLQHLLAVLPPTSSHLLPKAYQSLVTNKTSPIIDFYPSDFEIDLNGKTNDWEAVVILPFVDDKKLLDAIEKCNKKLTTKDRNRNKIGQTCVFTHMETSLGQYPVDTIYGNFENHAQLRYVKPEDVFVPNEKLVKGLCNNVDVNARYRGFPLMKRRFLSTFSFVTKEKKTNPLIKIETIHLTLPLKPNMQLDEIAKDLLKNNVFIDWPYYQDAYVIGVSDFKNKISLKKYWAKYEGDNLKRTEITENMSKILKQKVDVIANRYEDEMGIDIGETKVLVYVFPSLGKWHFCDNRGNVKLQNKWSTIAEIHPYQLIEKNVKQLENLVLYKTVKDVFSPSSTCVVVGHPHYGSMGKVKSVNMGQQLVTVALTISNEPDFSSIDCKCLFSTNGYFNSHMVADKLKVTSALIKRITASIKVKESLDDSRSFSIGLRIKSSKYNKELYEYTTVSNHQWQYSNKAVQLIKEYMQQFPDLFDKLQKHISTDVFKVSDLFPEDPSKINSVLSWLSEKVINYPEFRDCCTKHFESEQVQQIEQLTNDFCAESKTVEAALSYTMLFRPGTTTGLVSPDLKADHKLLDRVICVRENFTVPFGLKGTIIGMTEKENKLKSIYEVLFDSPFTGGLTLYESSEHKCYRMTIADFVNISHGQRDAKKSTTMESKPNARVEHDKEVRNSKNVPTNVQRESVRNETTKIDDRKVSQDSRNNSNNTSKNDHVTGTMRAHNSNATQDSNRSTNVPKQKFNNNNKGYQKSNNASKNNHSTKMPKAHNSNCTQDSNRMTNVPKNKFNDKNQVSQNSNNASKNNHGTKMQKAHNSNCTQDSNRSTNVPKP